MTEPRLPLYERLPEIYRIHDLEQEPPEPLRHYLALVEEVFGEIQENIETLYHDLFIETCDDWVIPYIGDLLGVSHLKGETWTLRADVADAVALRRRKGTLAGIERLVYDLTRWGVHCHELHETLVWCQHLNHQRPDTGGDPPYGRPSTTRFTPVRGGTLPVRDPAMLSLLNTPFDPYAHLPDLKLPVHGALRYNLPNLALFLWRLADYRVPMTRPYLGETDAVDPSEPDALHPVRVVLDPLGRPQKLFNTYQFDPNLQPPVVTELDHTPGPIPRVRLNQASEVGRPECYLAVETFDTTSGDFPRDRLADVGLQLHLPGTLFNNREWPSEETVSWHIRGADLSGWEACLVPPLQLGEIIIDPGIGRLLIGATTAEAEGLLEHLRVTYTYGAVGPVGAHPMTRTPTPPPWDADEVETWVVSPLTSLNDLLSRIGEHTGSLIIEFQDSLVHELELASDAPDLRLNAPLMIHAVAGERPIIRLQRPLRIRPFDVTDANDATLRLEGLYLTGSEDLEPDEPLIAQAAINRLEIINCTLDPGGHLGLDGNRADIRDSLRLYDSYDLTDPEEANAFDQIPAVVIQRSITGPLCIDRSYRLSLAQSIIDAGCSLRGETDAPYGSDGKAFTVTAAADPAASWGPPTTVDGVTFFGPMRVERIGGRGGIWTHSLRVLNDQVGCLKYSYFSGVDDRLPQRPACVDGTEARLYFTSQIFGAPGYGQLAHSSDFRIRERGPGDDAMGAYGFLSEAHKWRNLQIRFREFMPVGIRPLLIPVT